MGEFTIKKKKADTWVTLVEIQDGKVQLRFGHAERLFSYEEKGKKAILSISYTTEGSGRKRKNTLVLKK